jgi:hypothetical protein
MRKLLNLNVSLYPINSCIRKTQKILVDHVKVVIKGGKKFTADQKIRSLKLLNKAILKSDTNPEFLKYVQKKIMARLAILAQFCPKEMNPSDAGNLMSRGAHLFMPDERETVQSAKFLLLLLDCIEKWAN